MKRFIAISLIAFAAQMSSAQDGKRTVLKDSTQSITNVAQALEEVGVVHRIERTKMNGDVMVTRIAGSALSKAGTAEDALGRVPGLFRRNGQLEVIGKGAPVFYINGRKVLDPTELQRLSSQELREVEVISTPGAQYDAQTNAVVRIKTVRRRGDGIGGSIDMSDAYSPSHGDNRLASTLGLHYRHNSLELFGGATFDDQQLKRYETDFCQQTIGQSVFEQIGKTRMGQHYRSLKYNFGADWQMADNHSIGFRVERNDNLKGFTRFSMTDDVLLDGKQDDRLLSDTDTDADGVDSWSANTYYNGKIGKLDIDWNIDYYRTRESSLAQTHEQSLSDPRYVEAYGESGNDLYATKLVFNYPLGKGKLQFGTELDFVRRSNLYTITDQSIADDQTKVHENTYAAFAEYGFTTKVGMLNLGLRYEYVSFDYKSLLDPAQSLSRHTNNYYPTISFATQYKELQASLSYSVKTKRPNYRDLRSNIEYNNRYTLSTGNPKLSNEINHQVVLNMRWRYLTFSTNYQRKEKGIYDWTSQYDDQGRVLIGWVNLTKPEHSIGAIVNFTHTIGRWTPSYTIGTQKQWLSFDLPDPREAGGIRTVRYNKPMFLFNANNAYRIPSRRDDGTGAWQLELNSEFLSGFHYGNAEIENCFWNLQFAVQKSWFDNDALSLRLTVNDIAHMAHHNVRIDLGDYVLTQTHINGVSRSVYDPQTVSLSLRYKFNAAKSKYKGVSAGADMRSRM